MSEGKRPGGLTALAVFNFIGCGFDLLLGVLGSVGMIFLLQSDTFKELEQEAEAEAPPAKEATAEPGSDADPDLLPADPKTKPDRNADEKKQVTELRRMGITVRNLTIKIVLFAALSLLLLLSGIGYLKQKKFMGRKLGTIYAVASLATTYWELSLLPAEFRTGSATIGIVIAAVYPVITLLLINTIFKEDFTN